MLTLFFLFLALAFTGKILGFAFRATWGIAKFFLFLFFLPAIILIAVIGGLLQIALPVLVIVGIAMLIKNSVSCAN